LFRAVGPGVVGIQLRALTSFPQTGADSTWLHHTRMEPRSPSGWREQRNRRSVLCGLETYRCPHTVLFNKAAERASFASELQGRVRGSTRHPDVTSPSAEASERASHQRTGLRDVEPTCSYAFHDAVAQDYQSIGPRLLPAMAREAPGSPAPLPLAGEEFVPLERRIAFQHVIDRPSELVG
jgi:hypothetical protein